MATAFQIQLRKDQMVQLQLTRMATEHQITWTQTLMAMVSQIQLKTQVVQEQLLVHQQIQTAMAYQTTWTQILMATVFQIQ
jgi:hypothetical protein